MAENWPSSHVPLPKLDDVKARYLGTRLDDLPTPAVIIDRSLMMNNIVSMQKIVSEWNCLFRAHIKTHKTVEGTRLQLSQENDRAIIVSTLAEAWGVVRSRLIEEGVVDDILYGVPVGVHRIAEVLQLRKTIKDAAHKADMKLLIDHPMQVQALQEALKAEDDDPVSVFIKIDAGYHRAGVSACSEELSELVRTINGSGKVAVWGCYTHAGNSYGSKDASQAVSFLTGEVQAVNQAAKIVLKVLQEAPQTSRHRQSLILSVGSTPTAHAAGSAPSIEHLAILQAELHGTLELHAGNYPFLDLQQVATGAIPDNGTPPIKRCAMSVLSSILSVYPGRGNSQVQTPRALSPASTLAGHEVLCDASGMALSKDLGPFPGHGHVAFPPSLIGWKVGRVAQEHGVLTLREGTRADWSREWGISPLDHSLPQTPTIGQKIRIIPQHACMVAAAHPWYFVFDSLSSDMTMPRVSDVWIPWKGW